MQLQHSSVKRGGVTSPYWSGGTKEITAVVSEGCVEFVFTLPSKGGGETQVQLAVGLEDLRDLLEQLAEKNVSLATTFAECTKMTVSTLLQAHKSC